MSKPTPQQVKDRAAKFEADHLRRTTGEVKSRDLEAALSKGLARLEARKRARAAKQVAASIPTTQDPDRAQVVAKMAEREGFRYTRRAIDPAKKEPALALRDVPCKWCGRCKRCKREWRMTQILRRAREGCEASKLLAMQLVQVSQLAQAKLRDLETRDRATRDRIVTRKVEDICDRSDAVFGVRWWTR